MTHAKNKGSAYERFIVNTLKAWGYEAETARYVNQKLDDLGCDIVTNFPFSIQCKAVERLSMPAHQILKEMEQNGLENPILMHKRNNKGTTVTMSIETFKEISFPYTAAKLMFGKKQSK